MLSQEGSLCCNVCSKYYSRKSSLEKHKILCAFKQKTKYEIKVETEESADIPNHLQLAKIVQELTLKLIKMEEKMEIMQKYVDKKKKQINVLTWLNSNTGLKPMQIFKEWVKNSICVGQNDIENLMVNSLHYTFQRIFESQILINNDEIEDNYSYSYIYPVKSFQQKQNMIYIYDQEETQQQQNPGSKLWRQMNQEDFVLLLKIIQQNLIGELSKWKIANKGKFDESDKISDLFNRAVIKLMNVSFTPDSTFSKIRNSLYNHVKIDLKPLIEVEIV
jgi:hypothetical protein